MESCIPTAEAHSVLLMGSTTDLGTLRTQSALQQRQAQVADAARRLLQSETMVNMLQEAGVELPSFEELEMCRRRGLVPGRGDWRSAMGKGHTQGHSGATASDISGDGEGDSEGPPVSTPECAAASSTNTTPLAQPGMSPPRSPRRMTARGGWRQHVNRDDAYEKNPVVRRLKKLRHKVLYGKVGEKAYARYKAMLRANITWRDILRPNLAGSRKSTPKRGFSRWLDGATTEDERRAVREEAARVIQTSWRAFKRDRIDNVMQHVKNFEIGKYNWSDDDSVNTDELPDWWGVSSSSSSEDEDDKKKKKNGKKKSNSLKRIDVNANSNKRAVLAAVAGAMDEENMAEAITDANSKRKKKKKKKGAGDDGDGDDGGEEAPPVESPPEVAEAHPEPTEEDSGSKKKGKGKKGKGKKETENVVFEDAESDKGPTIAGEDSKDASFEAAKAKGFKRSRSKHVNAADLPEALVDGLGDSEVDILKGLVSAPPALEEQYSAMMEGAMVLEPEPLAPMTSALPLLQLPLQPPPPAAVLPPPPPAEEPKFVPVRKGKKGKKQEDVEVLEAAVVTLAQMELMREKPEPPPVEAKPGPPEPAPPLKEPPHSSLPGTAPPAAKPPPPPSALPNISPVTSMAPSPEASFLTSASVSASDVGLPAPTIRYSTDDDASRRRTSTISGTGAGSAAGGSGAGDNEPEDYKTDSKKKKKKKRSPRVDSDAAVPSTTFVTTYTITHSTTTPCNRTTGLPDWSKVGPSPDLFDAKTDPEKRAALLARMAREGGPDWRPPGVIAEWFSMSHYLYEGNDPDKRAEAMAKVAAVVASSGQPLWRPPGVSATHWVSMSKSMYDGNDPEKRAEAMIKAVNATPLNPMWRPPGIGPGIGRPRYDSGLFDGELEKPPPQEASSDQPPWRPPGVPRIEYYNYYGTMDSSTSSSSSSSEGEGDVAEKEGAEGGGEVTEGAEAGEVMTPEERAARRAQRRAQRRDDRRAARAQAAVARINGRQPWRFTYAVDEDTPVSGNDPPQVRYDNIVREDKCAPRPWKYTVIAEQDRSVPYNIWGPYVEPNRTNGGQQRSPRHESLLAQATKRLAAEASTSASNAASPSRIRSLSNTISGAPQSDAKPATDEIPSDPTASATTGGDTTTDAGASTLSPLNTLASPDITNTGNTASDPASDGNFNGSASGTGGGAVPLGDPSAVPAGPQASTGPAASGTTHGSSQLEAGQPRRARVQVLRRNVSMSQLEIARGPGKGLYHGRHSARHVGRLTTIGCAGSGGPGGSPIRSLPAPLLLAPQQQQQPVDAVTSLISLSASDTAGGMRGLPCELSVTGRPAGIAAARPPAVRSVVSGLAGEDSSVDGSYSGGEPTNVDDEGDVHRARAPFLHRHSPLREMEASNEGTAPAAAVTVTADGSNEADAGATSPSGAQHQQQQALAPMTTLPPSLSVQTLQAPAGPQPQPRASASGALTHQHAPPPPHSVVQYGFHHVLTHSELYIMGHSEDPAGPTPTPQVSQLHVAAESSAAAAVSEPPPPSQQPGQQSKPEEEPSELILHTVLSLPTPPCAMPEGLLAYVVSRRRRRRRWRRSYGGESNSGCESPSGRRGPPMLYPPALSSSAVEAEPRRICSARGQGAFSTAGIQPYPIEQDLLRSLPFHVHVAKRSRSAPASPRVSYGTAEELAGVGNVSGGAARGSNVGDSTAGPSVDMSGPSVAVSEAYLNGKYSHAAALGTTTGNNVTGPAPSAPVMLSRDDLPPLPAILQDQEFFLSRGIRLTAKRHLTARGAAQPNPREMFELLFLGRAARQGHHHEQQHNNSIASSTGGAGSPRVLSPRRKVPAAASNLSGPTCNAISGLLDAHVRAHVRLGAPQGAPPNASLQRAPHAHGLGVSGGLDPPSATSSWVLRERTTSHVVPAQRSVWQQPQQHPYPTAPPALLAQVGSLPPLRANSLPPLAHGSCPPPATTSTPLMPLAPGGTVTDPSRWSHTPTLATVASGPSLGAISFPMQPSYTQYTISVTGSAAPGAASDLRPGQSDGIAPLKSNSWRDTASSFSEVHTRPPSRQTPSQLGQGHVPLAQGQPPGRISSLAPSTTGSRSATQEGAGPVPLVDETSPANMVGPVSPLVQNSSLAADHVTGGGTGPLGGSAATSAELSRPSLLSTVPIPAAMWKVLPPISIPSTPQTPSAPVQQPIPPPTLPPKPLTPDQVLPPPLTPPTTPPIPPSPLTLGAPPGPTLGPPPSTPTGRSQRPSVSPATYLFGGMPGNSTNAPRASNGTPRLPAVTGSRRGTVSPPGVRDPGVEAVAPPLGSLAFMEPMDQAAVAQRRKARGQLRTGRAPLGPPLASRVPEKPPGATTS